MKSLNVYLCTALLGSAGAFTPTSPWTKPLVPKPVTLSSSPLTPPTRHQHHKNHHHPTHNGRLAHPFTPRNSHPSRGMTSLQVVPAAAAAASITLPCIKALTATSLVPTCLGYYRYEYGVSYGYGTATAATAYLILQALQTASPTGGAFASMAQCHARAIIFYGLRLNSFLLFREVFLERFRMMRERIEDRQRKKEVDTGMIGKFFNRTPFILSCALLYAGLAAPPLISATLIELGAVPTCEKALLAYRILVGLAWSGFIIGAIGDFAKSFTKGRKGADHLVTGGIFSVLRHPNYTGEILGWTSSFLASVLAIATASTSGVKLSVLKQSSALLGLAFMGNLGILFVLCAATSNLEKRQKEKYGDSKEYQDWVSSSWSGPKLSSKKAADE